MPSSPLMKSRITVISISEHRPRLLHGDKSLSILQSSSTFQDLRIRPRKGHFYSLIFSHFTSLLPEIVRLFKEKGRRRRSCGGNDNIILLVGCLILNFLPSPCILPPGTTDFSPAGAQQHEQPQSAQCTEHIFEKFWKARIILQDTND